jgi:hypothetical protein
MKKLALILVLGLAGSLHAQRTDGVPVPPRQERCACYGGAADCLFGEAAECTVTCPPGQHCKCRGAYCVLGFPRPSLCQCV